jgi:hypothetical protein
VNAATRISGKIAEKTKHIISPREKFLVLEVAPQGANALFLSVDEDRKMTVEKIVKNVDLKKFLQSPLRRLSQKSWEGEWLFKSHRKVIVSADSSVATTMPVPLDFARDRAQWKDEVTLTELENLIAQAMAKIFTQCRSEAAKRLGVDDINTILVGAKADRFKIDGHSVMNPIGFAGRKVSLLLELTFTVRDVFENLKQFFNSPDEFFFIETPQAWLLSAARIRELPLNLISITSSEEADSSAAKLFVFEKAGGIHPILYRETLNWSFDKLFSEIVKALGVGIGEAKKLYRTFRAGELSPNAARAFQKIIRPEIDALLFEIERAKVVGSVYFDALYPAPFDAPYKYKSVTFENIPTREILDELDLVVGDVPPESLRNLAPFLEAYFAKNASEINQKLRRRLHWLV